MRFTITNDFDAVHRELVTNGVVFEVYLIEGNFHSDDGERPYWDEGVLVFPDGGQGSRLIEDSALEDPTAGEM